MSQHPTFCNCDSCLNGEPEPTELEQARYRKQCADYMASLGPSAWERFRDERRVRDRQWYKERKVARG